MRHICFSLIQQMDVLIQNGLYENDEPDDSEPGSESEDAPDVAQDCYRQCERSHIKVILGMRLNNLENIMPKMLSLGVSTLIVCEINMCLCVMFLMMT